VKQLGVSGLYPLQAPWRVAAVAAVLAHVSGVEVEARDEELWGQDGPACMVRGSRTDLREGRGLLLRWGARPGALADGAAPLWLSSRGEQVDEAGREWQARECGPYLTLRTLPQVTPPAVSAALSMVNSDQ
jgi:hypothetical protein